jgi:hypothetical protein
MHRTTLNSFPAPRTARVELTRLPAHCRAPQAFVRIA